MSIILEVKAGEFNKEISIERRPKIVDVEHITKRVFLHLGAAVREAGLPVDYFETCETIYFKLSYGERVETATFLSVDEMFKSVHGMVDNIIVVDN